MKNLLTILLLFIMFSASAQQKKKSHFNVDGNNRVPLSVGLGLTASGVMFTGAILLERNTYWTYIPNPSNPNQPNYVTTPFWQQTPRQALFVVGVGITITGLFTMMANK